MAETREITWDPEADRRIKRSPFLMRRFIRKRIEDRVANRPKKYPGRKAALLANDYRPGPRTCRDPRMVVG
jgi:hypothetical protein